MSFDLQVISRRSFVSAALTGGAVLSRRPAPERTRDPQQRPAHLPRIIVFDVNETLLDINALEPHFVRVFKDARVLREWFSTVLLYSQVATLAGPYSDFSSIGAAALEMTAASRGVSLSAADRDGILKGMLSLPAYPDALGGLRRLRDAGLRLVTLTNSSSSAVKQQLAHAGLSDLFERAFSVDAVRRFKPAPEPYQLVAKELRVETGQLRMVAAHAWDIAGAIRAGCAAAFVARPGKVLYPLAQKPDIVGSTILAVSERIIESEIGRP